MKQGLIQEQKDKEKYKYNSHTDDSEKYLQKRYYEFPNWKKSRRNKHILHLWRQCYAKAYGASIIINQMHSIDLKMAYFGRHMLNKNNEQLNYDDMSRQ